MVIFHSYVSLPEGTKRCCKRRFKAKGLKSSSSFAQVAPIAGAWTVTSPACGDAVAVIFNKNVLYEPTNQWKKS
jgi:hypothetical protein